MDIKMGQLQILRIFFENPAKEFHIRGIAKMLKIPKSSVSYHVGQLVEQDIIKRKETGVFPSFAADQTSEMYHFWKRQDAMKRMIESSLLDYLDEQLNPKCIVLFGSFAKAEHWVMPLRMTVWSLMISAPTVLCRVGVPPDLCQPLFDQERVCHRHLDRLEGKQLRIVR